MSKTKFTKLIIATLLGSLTMFLWGYFSHAAFFIGTGFSPLPNEARVKEALKTNITGKGLYFFAGQDRSAPKELEAVFKDTVRNGPVGLIVYKPVSGNPFLAGKLMTQFLGNVLSVLIAVQIASLIQAGYWKRVLAVTQVGLLACSAVSSLYWNWYALPASLFIAQILDMEIGFFLAGLVICKVLPETKA